MSGLRALLRRAARALRPRDPRHARGAAGEKAAAKFLERNGLRVVERNLRTPAGEIDLAALDGDCLVVIEVKVKAAAGGAPAKLQVDRAKARRLQAGAEWLAKRRRWKGSLRIDVLARDGDAGPWQWLKGAVPW